MYDVEVKRKSSDSSHTFGMTSCAKQRGCHFEAQGEISK